MMQLVFQFAGLFLDTPIWTGGIFYHVNVGDTRPIKQHLYRVNLQEITYMLQNDLIEGSKSEWNSPCILVHKTYCFCTDF